MIGDRDPEDAYDAGDPPVDLLRILEAVVDVLRYDPDDGRHEARRVDALRLVAGLEARPPGVDRHRLARLRTNLEALAR